MAGELLCVDAPRGTVRWRWSSGAGLPIEATVAVADLDGDGRLDIVVAGHDRTLTALSGRLGR